MKKILVFLIAVTLFALLFTACAGPDETTAETTVEGGADTTLDTTLDTTTEEEVSVTTPGNLIVEEAYTATPNEEEWSEDTVDFSQYDYCGSGSTVVNKINQTFNGYQKTYVLKNEDGTTEDVSHTQVRKLGTAGIRITSRDDTAKTITLEVRDIAVKVLPEWTAVTAKAGTYLMFDFITNIPTDFVVTVTLEKGGSASSAVYSQDGITASEEDGKYVGVAKCTVPYQEGKTYYINICLDTTGTPAVVSIPVEITKAKYDSPYSLIFQGDWELVRDETYLDRLVELFYNVYPRVYARFGDGTEPKVITFMADKDYEGVAYNAGTLVCVSTAYANSSPDDIGFFAHEITHAVQQYDNKMYYGDGAWWTEFMADLGRFRYFHWGYSTDYVKIYSMDDDRIRDFGWQPYGQHNIFASYLDARWPTTIDENGNVTYGLVDSINRMIKETTTPLHDDPYKAGTPFNNKVKEITGFETMEAVRLHFVEELDAGTYVFTGYRDYLDNFTTEGIQGIPDPVYPMYEPVAKGNITNSLLATPVTEGTNLLSGATLVEYSSKGVAKNVIDNLIDGDVSTKWQGSVSKTDNKYMLGSYDHEILIDLGKETAFNTYTFYNASTVEREAFNMKSWELFVSTDGVNFTSVDYQPEVNQDIVSVNVGDQSARYIMLRIHKADQNGTGTVRLYEFMLFNQES